jgi:predicted alpha/beta hydrolase
MAAGATAPPVDAVARVPARDGYPLAATVFEPAGPPRGVVVVSSAMAVTRGYYADFAAYLAERGLRAVTYDYRGIGGSAPPRLRGFRATLTEWGEQDLAGVLAWAAEGTGAVPLFLVGHSAGGQLFGIAPGNERVRAAVTVAAQSGYWGLWPRPSRYRLGLVWLGLIPTVTALFGYVPPWAGMRAAVPGGVAREWARWGRHPQYLIGPDPSRREAFARVGARIRAYGAEGDFFAPPAAIDALHAWYTRASVERRQLGREVGHFGFFRGRFRDTLWREAADWLLEA